MNIIVKPNIKVKKKMPCFYEFFTEIYPKRVLDTSVSVAKHQTNSNKCVNFYKNISIFS